MAWYRQVKAADWAIPADVKRAFAAQVSSSMAANTIRRAELKESETSLTTANDLAIRRVLEAAGVEFIDENGGGPGVRLRKRHQKKS